MEVNVETNPNCNGFGQMIFNELDEKKPIKAIVVAGEKGDELCDVVGVESNGSWSQCYAQKINDSGEGTAYLIFGGDWGIRLKPQRFSEDPWDLDQKNQWGEPYKVYGSEEDLVYGAIESSE